MKKRLTTYFFLIAALGIALSSLFGVWAYRERELSAARQTLVELLDLIDAQDYYTDSEAWTSQLRQAAPDKRLTIIAPDGTVLSDTYGEVTENHADRPEVIAAAETGWGEAERRSETTGESLLYEAKRFTDGNVGRISMPISSVNALFFQGLAGFLGAAAVALSSRSFWPESWLKRRPSPWRKGRRPWNRREKSSRLYAASLPPMSPTSSRPPSPASRASPICSIPAW